MDLKLDHIKQCLEARDRLERLYGEANTDRSGAARYWVGHDFSNGDRIAFVVKEEIYSYNNRYYTYYDCVRQFRISLGELMRFDALINKPDTKVDTE